jgi:fatty acid synthase
MSETNGRGVDILLNSLAEEKLRASLRCLAPGGRFLEIEKLNLQNNNTIGIVTISLILHGLFLAGGFIKHSVTADNDFLLLHLKQVK